MLHVDERDLAAGLLGAGEDMQRERRLTGRLGTVDLHDAALGIAAYAERHVERDRTRRDDRNVVHFGAVHAHDRAFAEVLLYFLHHCVQHFELVRVYLYFFCHYGFVLYH